MSDPVEDRLRHLYRHRAAKVDATPAPGDLTARARSQSASPPARRRRVVPLVAAVVLALACAGWIGITVLESVPVESPFNTGGELECSGIRTMTPAEAEAELRDRGYDVEWQYHPTPGSEMIRTRPPATDDTVVVGVVLSGNTGTALVLVESYDADDALHLRLRSEQLSCEPEDG